MATELAKAYIQVVPSANGIKGSLENVMGKEADSAGEKAGSSIASKIKLAIAAAGIGKAISAAVTEGAALEQSIGGIETLFKDNADIVRKYAAEAYKTAGISANDYMEQTTSFAASLLSAVNGNTREAAESANQAIIDMADNANKLGTPLENIQNAYQGFAKQNYTMLDNLKLGYGGTKTEMERLLADAQELSGQKYDISNLNDVYSAIHVIQNELGITGTTAKEASETISGSYASMLASFKDFLGNMALGESIGPSLQNLLKTTSTFLFKNLLPMVGNIVMQIPDILKTIAPLIFEQGVDMVVELSKGFKNGIPNLLSSGLKSIQEFANYLAAQAPTIIEKGFEMLNNFVDGIINAIPVMISKLPQIITTFANIITYNFPTILSKGSQLLLKFISGIISTIPTLIANIPQIIRAIYSTIMAYNWLSLGNKIINLFGTGISAMKAFIAQKGKDILNSIVNVLINLPSTLSNLGKNMIKSLGNAIKNSTGITADAIGSIFNSIYNVVSSLPNRMISIGSDIVRGLWSGISNVSGWIKSKISGFVDGIVGGIKDFFGINSPSKLMADEIGKFIPPGITLGFENALPQSITDMEDGLDTMTAQLQNELSTNVNLEYQTARVNESSTALNVIIQLLQMLVDACGKEVIINLNNRELVRALKELGVVFS